MITAPGSGQQLTTPAPGLSYLDLSRDRLGEHVVLVRWIPSQRDVALRHPKLKLLAVTQSAFAVLSAVLGVVTMTGRVTLTWVLAVEIGFGLVSAADGPGRQAFVREMVARGQVPNAVTLNSVMANATRAIGPAVTGVLIASVSLGLCFVVNASRSPELSARCC